MNKQELNKEAEKSGGFYGFLKNGPIYSLFQHLLGANNVRDVLVREYIRPNPGQRILDIGCGTADILSHLPDHCEYYGCDPNPSYVSMAAQRYGEEKGMFLVLGLDADGELKLPENLPDIDIVICVAVCHHLDDQQADGLFRATRALLAKNKKNGGGRLVLLDNCLTETQSRFARWIILRDRGAFIRPADWYVSSLRKHFSTVRHDIRTDLLSIPYTHIIAEASLPIEVND